MFNMLGDFEKSLVIDKLQKPRCFKNIDVKKLGVTWKANRKAWMMQDIMTEWLTKFDRKMVKLKTKFFFLHDALSHTKFRLRNVELVFFPLNTTSVDQPPDQEIIQNFKAHYGRFLLTRVLIQLDKVTV